MTVQLAEKYLCITCQELIGEIEEDDPDTWVVTIAAVKQHLLINPSHEIGRRLKQKSKPS